MSTSKTPSAIVRDQVARYCQDPIDQARLAALLECADAYDETAGLKAVIEGNGQARVELLKKLDAAAADNAILKRLLAKYLETQDDTSLDSAAAGQALMHQRGYDLLRYCRGYLQDERLISLAEYVWLASQASYATQGDPNKPGPRRLESYDEMRERLTHLDAMEIVANLGYHLSTYAATVRTDGTPNRAEWLEDLFTCIEAVQLAAKNAGIKATGMNGNRPDIYKGPPRYLDELLECAEMALADGNTDYARRRIAELKEESE